MPTTFPIHFGRQFAEAVALGFHAKVPMVFPGESCGTLSDETRKMCQLLEVPCRMIPGHEFDFGWSFFGASTRDLPSEGTGILLIKRLDETRGNVLRNLREMMEEGITGNYRFPSKWVVFATISNDKVSTMRGLGLDLMARFCLVNVKENYWAWPNKALELEGDFANGNGVQNLWGDCHEGVEKFRYYYTNPNSPTAYHDHKLANYRWGMASRLMKAAEYLGDSIKQGCPIGQSALKACLESVFASHNVAERFLKFNFSNSGQVGDGGSIDEMSDFLHSL